MGIKTDGHWEQKEPPKLYMVQIIIFKKMLFQREPNELAQARGSSS